MGEIRDTGFKPRSDIICLEGNGYRPSHFGDGWKVGGVGIIVLNDQGGTVMDITYDVTNTLRAQDHGHPPSVLVYDARGNGGVKRARQ